MTRGGDWDLIKKGKRVATYYMIDGQIVTKTPAVEEQIARSRKNVPPSDAEPPDTALLSSGGDTPEDDDGQS